MPTRPTTYTKANGIRVRRNLKHAANIDAIQKNLRNKKTNVRSIDVASSTDRGKPVHRVKQVTG